jgi:hypothetical protein
MAESNLLSRSKRSLEAIVMPCDDTPLDTHSLGASNFQVNFANKTVEHVQQVALVRELLALSQLFLVLSFHVVVVYFTTSAHISFLQKNMKLMETQLQVLRTVLLNSV